MYYWLSHRARFYPKLTPSNDFENSCPIGRITPSDVRYSILNIRNGLCDVFNKLTTRLAIGTLRFHLKRTKTRDKNIVLRETKWEHKQLCTCQERRNLISL